MKRLLPFVACFTTVMATKGLQISPEEEEFLYSLRVGAAKKVEKMRETQGQEEDFPPQYEMTSGQYNKMIGKILETLESESSDDAGKRRLRGHDSKNHKTDESITETPISEERHEDEEKLYSATEYRQRFYTRKEDPTLEEAEDSDEAIPQERTHTSVPAEESDESQEDHGHPHARSGSVEKDGREDTTQFVTTSSIVVVGNDRKHKRTHTSAPAEDSDGSHDIREHHSRSGSVNEKDGHEDEEKHQDEEKHYNETRVSTQNSEDEATTTSKLPAGHGRKHKKTHTTTPEDEDSDEAKDLTDKDSEVQGHSVSDCPDGKDGRSPGCGGTTITTTKITTIATTRTTTIDEEEKTYPNYIAFKKKTTTTTASGWWPKWLRFERSSNSNSDSSSSDSSEDKTTEDTTTSTTTLKPFGRTRL